MRISWKWLSELIDLNSVGGPDGLAELLTRRGLEVESIEPQSQGFDHVVTAQILEKKPHPQADRLSLCKVTIGSGAPLDIVCGAQNMKAGDKVALAQIGAVLPNGLKIQQSKIRGETSNGMLCSDEELKLKEKSEGIIILPEKTPLGKPLAEILGRDDTVLVLKLTANRGDCLSHHGLAREVGAALGKKPKKIEVPVLKPGKCPISISLEADAHAPQFWGVLIDGVKVGPSPDWLVRRLETVGSRSINNVVDATNLVMLELGNPTHAYDATRIEGKKIGVRHAKKGEALPLLDGTSVTLTGSELVIFDGKRAIGLAGVMGGGNSEVLPGTTQIFLECAEFEPSITRRAASRHQRRTDAAQRFEKGIDPGSVPLAIARLAHWVTELAGGKIMGVAAAHLPSRDPKKGAPQKKIQVFLKFFESFLGMPVTSAAAEKILKGLECSIQKKGDHWTVIPPSYRLDLKIPEDL
ncbi:MAG: phenylalanine--tRNA ligase subunit beta, partial [Bdellovibrionota bacterium]